jgi:hypothetical protein
MEISNTNKSAIIDRQNVTQHRIRIHNPIIISIDIEDIVPIRRLSWRWSSEWRIMESLSDQGVDWFGGGRALNLCREEEMLEEGTDDLLALPGYESGLAGIRVRAHDCGAVLPRRLAAFRCRDVGEETHLGAGVGEGVAEEDDRSGVVVYVGHGCEWEADCCCKVVWMVWI